MSRGSSRGTAAARATAYDRLATRQPRAAGNSHGLSSTTAVASTQARNARVASVVPSAQRRPCRNRSSSGPMSGASSTNGAMVSTRNRATRPRASSVGSANTVPASETVRAASAGDVDRVQLGEPGEPGVGGAVGVGEAAEPPPAAAPPRPTRRAPARPPRPTLRPTLRRATRRRGVPRRRLLGSLVGGHDPSDPPPRTGAGRSRPRGRRCVRAARCLAAEQPYCLTVRWHPEAGGR